MAEAVVITADILDRGPMPALSSTSDMPLFGEAAVAEVVVDETPPAEGNTEAVDTAAEGADGEVAQEGEGATDEPEVVAEPAKPRAKPGINERFSTLTEARKAAEARAAAAEKTAADAVAALAALTKAEPVADPPPVVEPVEQRPVRETFDTPEDYDEALIEWSTKRAAQIFRAENEQHARSEKETADREAAATAQEVNFKAMQTTHLERRQAAVEKYPDYEQVAESDSVQISMPMGLAIMRHEDGPAAAYYLGQHPEIAAKIAGMVMPGEVFPPGNPMAGMPVPDVQRQLIEMGRVFAAVAEPETPKPVERPAPPAPISPLRRGGNNAAVTRTLEEVGNEPGSMEEYAARRMQDLRAVRH